MEEAIHVGDIGIKLQYQAMENGVAVDLSSATLKQILLLKPDQSTVLTKVAVFETDGSDGKINYLTIAGDIDQDGLWLFQPYIETADWKAHLPPALFKVKPNVA